MKPANVALTTWAKCSVGRPGRPPRAPCSSGMPPSCILPATTRAPRSPAPPSLGFRPALSDTSDVFFHTSPMTSFTVIPSRHIWRHPPVSPRHESASDSTSRYRQVATGTDPVLLPQPVLNRYCLQIHQATGEEMSHPQDQKSELFSFSLFWSHYNCWATDHYKQYPLLPKTKTHHYIFLSLFHI